MMGDEAWPRMYKMPFFDHEMCTLQKVCGEVSKGRRILCMPETSILKIQLSDSDIKVHVLEPLFYKRSKLYVYMFKGSS